MACRWISVLIAVVCLIGVSATGCGSDDPGGGGIDVGSGDDVGPTDVGPDADVGPGEDTGPGEDVDAGYQDDTDVDPPDDAPTALDDFLICEANHDCPINGSLCVQEVIFNRVDADGTEEIAVAELFDDVDDGEGICTRNCAEDATRCDTIYWADADDQAHPSSCMVVATGLEPYEVISDDPFEVEVDLGEMEQGQAFGAICLPPFAQAEGRSETFCAGCSAEEDCVDETVCYNALNEDLRQSPDELGDSFCVESCEEQSDCPMGFDCLTVGDDDDDDAPAYCLPVEDTCSDCIDRDQDGYGTGHCGPADARQTPFDCDDTNPDAYFDPDNMEHPFPDHCYDDPQDERFFYDLNCSGVLDHVEQIGADNYPEEHCTACGDECTGEVDDGFHQCMIDADGQPYCGVGCQPGFAVCGGDPSDGCSIDIEAEKLKGSDQPYRDQESPYIWFDADDGDEWAHVDAEPHFFCTDEEAQAALDNPVQRRGCHPEGESQRHPGRTQDCVDVDVNCDGLTGLEDPNVEDIIDGNTYTAGDSCDTGEAGICASGTAECTDSGMQCAQNNSAVDPPTCSNQDTNCAGSPDSTEDLFTYDGEGLTLLDDDGNELGQTPGTVEVGTPCEVDGALGQCRLGEVRCDGNGLYCHQMNFPQPEQPGFDGIDHSCQGVDRYLNSAGQPHVIHVDTSDNSPTLTEAIGLAEDCDLTIGGEQIPCDVFVEDASLTTYGTVTLSEGVHVYGGFDVASWDPREDNFQVPDYGGAGSMSQIHVEFPNFDDSTVEAVGLEIPNSVQEETHFWGIELSTQDLDDYQSCRANVGALCDGCDGIYLKQVSISAGAAPGGEDGAFDGQNGASAALTPYPDGDGPAGLVIHEPEETEPWQVDFLAGEGGFYDGGRPGDSIGSWGVAGQPNVPHGGAPGEPWWAGGEPAGSGTSGKATSPLSVSNTSPYNIYSLIDGLSCPWVGLGIPSWDSHGGGGGGSGVNCQLAGPDAHCAVAGGGGGGEAGSGGWGARAGGLSIGFLVKNTEISPGDGARFEIVNVDGGAGGAGGDGADGGDGGDGAPGVEAGAPFATTRSGAGGGGAGGPGGVGGNGGHSIGLLRYQSPRQSGVDLQSGAGVAGQGGQGGQGGSGGAAGTGGDAGGEDGIDGPMGVAGWVCAQLSIDSEEISWDQPSGC